MIKIGQIHSHLGDGVFSMVCDCNTMEFLVNTREGCLVNYNPKTGLVRCPWCGIQVGLSIILENHNNMKNLVKISDVDFSITTEENNQ